MSTEHAMLLSATIGVGATLITLLITRFFDARSEKRKAKERFFYEIFSKRITLYEEIIKATDFLSNTEETSHLDSPSELADYYKEKMDDILSLAFRCSIFASERVVSTLSLLVNAIAEFTEFLLGLHELRKSIPDEDLIDTFTPRAISIKRQLIEFIREESGTYMIDEKSADFMRDFEISQNKKNNIKNKK
jgi:hypothetical protein